MKLEFKPDGIYENGSEKPTYPYKELKGYKVMDNGGIKSVLIKKDGGGYISYPPDGQKLDINLQAYGVNGPYVSSTLSWNDKMLDCKPWEPVGVGIYEGYEEYEEDGKKLKRKVTLDEPVSTKKPASKPSSPSSYSPKVEVKEESKDG